MNKFVHKTIYVVGLVTTVVYAVKAVNYVLPIGEKIIVDALASKFEDAVNNEVIAPVDTAAAKKNPDRVSFTVTIPRRRRSK